MIRWLILLANAFPLWLFLGGGAALVRPEWFRWISGTWIIWGLTIIMLGMGLTLSVEDFRRAGKMPRAVSAGLIAQYILMPLTAWGVATLLALPQAFAVGLILVGCCPGGTASNVIAYLARANVALSVLMTMCSTVAAIVMTPLLVAWLAGEYVAVDGWGIFLTTMQVVIAPILLGLVLHHTFPKLVGFILPAGPLVSVIVITLICTSIISHNAESIFAHGKELLLSVSLLHCIGFLLGLVFARLLGYDNQIARTIAIETGMQNSGLAAVLARTHFAIEPLTAVPAAIASVCQSIIGSLLAALWRLKR